MFCLGFFTVGDFFWLSVFGFFRGDSKHSGIPKISHYKSKQHYKHLRNVPSICLEYQLKLFNLPADHNPIK